MLDHFRGVLTFRAAPFSPENFLDEIKKSPVSARKIIAKNGILEGEIYAFDKKGLLSLAEKSDTPLEFVKSRGLILRARKYSARYGVIIGLVLSLLLIFYLSNIVLRINIYGNETLTDEEIKAVLADNGLYIGAFLPSVSLRAAETSIVSGVRKIGWIGIRRSGCILEAEISEMTLPPDIVDTNMPCNVSATRDAQIVKIVAVPQGMLVPMLYDTVRENEILVTGVIQGKLGNTYLVHAEADIRGRYSEKQTFSQNLIDASFELNDKKSRNYLYLFGARIPLFLTAAVDEGESFEYTEEKNLANLFSLELPVGIIYGEYKTYVSSQRAYSKEAAHKLLDEKIARYERNFLDENQTEIISKEVTYSDVPNGIKADVSYVLESNICKTEYIFAKNHK
jgi:similar to stage IV sporulation protein